MVRQPSIAMMCLALCVTAFVFGPAPAQAIPLPGDYVFTSGLEGAFTSNGSQLTAWSINDVINPITWANTDSANQIVQGNNAIGFLTALRINGFPIGFNILWDAKQFVDYDNSRGLNAEGNFSFTAAPTPVPLGSSGSMFTIGLLGLAVYGWWRSRQAGLQVA